MAAFCKSIGDCFCLPTDINGDPAVAVRNAKIKSAVATLFLTLAAVALAVGVAGFFGNKLGTATNVLAKNALWVTLAGGIALALALITSVGYYCSTRNQTQE